MDEWERSSRRARLKWQSSLSVLQTEMVANNHLLHRSESVFPLTVSQKYTSQYFTNLKKKKHESFNRAIRSTVGGTKNCHFVKKFCHKTLKMMVPLTWYFRGRIVCFLFKSPALAYLAFMPQFSNFSHPHHARFPFILSAPILVSSPITFSFFFSLHLTSLTSSCHPRYPLVLSSLFLSSRPSSLICSVSLLSCFQPSPLILPVSSYPTFRSSFHPFPLLSV